MDPATLAMLASAGSSVTSSLFGASSAIKSQQMANEANVHLLHDQQDWNEYMTRHAHQFEVEDLRKAGLNPILSAGGSGNIPSNVPTPTVQPEVSSNTSSMIGGAIQSALSAMKSIADVRASNANASVIEAEVPGAKNEAKFQGSWYAKNVLPALNSTAKMLGNIIGFSGNIGKRSIMKKYVTVNN